jgi:hypothetical protein
MRHVLVSQDPLPHLRQCGLGFRFPVQSRKVARHSDPGSPERRWRDGSTLGTRASLSSILSKFARIRCKCQPFGLLGMGFDIADR